MKNPENFLEKRRSTEEEIRQGRCLVAQEESIEKVLSTFSLKTLIFNGKRHILYGNYAFLEGLKKSRPSMASAPRLGEAVGCVHAWDSPFGCGTGASCFYCGAAQAMHQCLEENRKVVKECVVETADKGSLVNFEWQITVSPLVLQESRFLFLTLEDISHEKYRERMERTFFHDIMNSAGIIQGVAEALEDTVSTEERQELLTILEGSSSRLVEEIQIQRNLLFAERGTLQVQIETLDGEALLRKAAREMRFFPEISRGKEVIVQPSLTPLYPKGDETIVRRVLINMVKNALEATSPGEQVILGSYREEGLQQNRAVFWVRNREVMSVEVQRNVFQRSFSTKGVGRGIGTYSMKLFVKNYLQGDIWFCSNEKEGTTFYVALPL